MSGRKRGFSLIELIVVCVIVAVLLALAMGGLGVGGRSARRLAGLSEAQGIAEAISQYRERYRQWPPGVEEATASAVTGRLVRVLAGEEDDDRNPARIRFVTFKQFARDSTNGAIREMPLTPWGRQGDIGKPLPSAFYYAQVDSDRDGRIEVRIQGMATSLPVRADVAVWAANMDAVPESDIRSYVGSWE